MKKIFLMACVALFSLAACQKAVKEVELTDTSLANTTWHYEGEDYISDLTFLEGGEVYHHEHYLDDDSNWTYWGSYGFDGKQGSATLNCYGDQERFSFTVSGDQLTVNFEGELIVHRRTTFVNPK